MLGNAAALAECATSTVPAGKIYNLSEMVALERFVEIIAGELGINPPLLHVPEPLLWIIATTAKVLPRFPLTHSRIDALTNRAVVAAGRIADDLAYNSAISLETGLRKLVRARTQTRSHAI